MLTIQNFKTFRLAIFALNLKIILILTLSSCVSVEPHHWSTKAIDKELIRDPAVQRFIEFADIAKTVKNTNEIADQFYTSSAAKQLRQQKGWYRLVYSANHFIMRNMDCESLELTRQSRNTVYIDCTGTFKAQSTILGSTLEQAHLRTHMKLSDGTWRFERSGYVHTHTFGDFIGLRKGGIKFDSPLLIHEQKSPR